MIKESVLPLRGAPGRKYGFHASTAYRVSINDHFNIRLISATCVLYIQPYVLQRFQQNNPNRHCVFIIGKPLQLSVTDAPYIRVTQSHRNKPIHDCLRGNKGKVSRSEQRILYSLEQ
jgi:hypothetical protein